MTTEAREIKAGIPSPFAMSSPLDGTALSEVAATPMSEIPELVARAHEAQRAWADRNIAQRIKAIAPAKSRLLDRAETIASAVHKEIGRPEVEVLLGEILPSADVVGYWTDSIEELMDPMEVALDKLAFPGKSGLIHREPRGVIGLISPWNMPIAIPLRTMIPALLAGNAIVWKPSEVSPRAAQFVKEAFDGLPEGLLSIVQGGAEAGAAIASANVDLVVFTGSVATGRKVAHACAERLVPCSLELGGKDAAIVLADANLDRAANGIVWGALTMCGQNCASVERVYVEKGVSKEFTDKVVEIVKSLRAGDVGPLATERQRKIVSEHVEGAKKAGANVIVGGAEGKEGYAYAPTVLTVESDDLPIMRDETFGPVIPIATVESAEEAVTRANASRYGLTASVWTRKTARGEELAKRLRAGVVTINNHAFTGALPAAPWSGVGETGYGITNSPLALEALTRPRFVLVDRNRAKRELWWYPYTPTIRTIALAFAALRSKTSSIVTKVRAVLQLVGALPKRLLGE
jgi:acyl-CoA reductase-like NAD-dependent aldehyde dehydrogenase